MPAHELEILAVLPREAIANILHMPAVLCSLDLIADNEIKLPPPLLLRRAVSHIYLRPCEALGVACRGLVVSWTGPLVAVRSLVAVDEPRLAFRVRDLALPLALPLAALVLVAEPAKHQVRLVKVFLNVNCQRHR